LGIGCSSLSSQTKNAEGVKLYNQARYNEALLAFQRAANFNPDDADSYYNLGATHHRIASINQQSDQFSQAERYYRLCLDRNPNHASCYRGLSVLLMETQRPEAAYELLAGWSQRNPLAAEPKIELARLYEEAGRDQEAIGQLVEVIAMDEANDRALRALGHIREKTGELHQALANYRSSLHHNRFQDELADRIAMLESSLGVTPGETSPTRTAPDNPAATRMAGRSGPRSPL
jgi:tetratricopeptide (TPR) repeat protein